MSSSEQPASRMRDGRSGSERDIVLATLNACTKLIRRMSDEEVAQFLSGELVLELSSRGKAKDSVSNSRRSAGAIRKTLQGFTHPEEVVEFLKREPLTRKSLEAVARELDLPVTRADTAVDLRAKIVEGTVGYRSRSRAIRGGTDDPDNR